MAGGRYLLAAPMLVCSTSHTMRDTKVLCTSYTDLNTCAHPWAACRWFFVYGVLQMTGKTVCIRCGDDSCRRHRLHDVIAELSYTACRILLRFVPRERIGFFFLLKARLFLVALRRPNMRYGRYKYLKYIRTSPFFVCVFASRTGTRTLSRGEFLR